MSKNNIIGSFERLKNSNENIKNEYAIVYTKIGLIRVYKYDKKIKRHILQGEVDINTDTWTDR